MTHCHLSRHGKETIASVSFSFLCSASHKGKQFLPNSQVLFSLSRFSWQTAGKCTPPHGKRHVFSCRPPRIAASEGGNSGRFSSKFHYLFTRKVWHTGFLGLAARKSALLPVTAAPTALRSRGNCLPLWSGICREFLPCGRGVLVQAIALCPSGRRIRGRAWHVGTKKPRPCGSRRTLRRCWCQITKSECDAQQLTGKLMHARDDTVGLLLTRNGTVVEVVGELLLIDASHFLHASQ